MYKNVFRSLVVVSMAFFCFVFFSPTDVSAATRTASGGGFWSDTAVWGGAAVPTSSDDVIIADGVSVTVDINANANSIVFNSSTASNNITINSSISLGVATNITINAPSADNVTSAVFVSTGSLYVDGDILINGGSTGTARISLVSVITVNIQVLGDITFSGTPARAQFNSGGNSTIYIGGDFGSGGALSMPGGGTMYFNGSGAQAIAAYSNYNHITINNGSTTTLSSGSFMMAGNLSVSGTFDIGSAIAVGGTTTVNSGGTITVSSGVAGDLAFTGLVTVASGGTWNETAATSVNFSGGLTNSGTFTASTGNHFFDGTAKTITGTISIPTVTISGTTSNAGTLTVSTALAGASTLTNSATGTLNIGGTSGITGLTSTATGNIVTYNKSGAQTVKEVSYDTLNLSGSGVKTIGSGITIADSLTIASGVSVALTGNSTANDLTIDGTLKVAGTWGSTSSSATNQNDTYFSGTGIITVATGFTPTSGGGGGVVNYGHAPNIQPQNLGNEVISFIATNYSSVKNSVVVTWNNVVNATGMSFSIDPKFIGGVISSFVKESTFVLPSVSGVIKLYGRVYTSTGDYVQYGPVIVQEGKVSILNQDIVDIIIPEKTKITIKDFSNIKPTPKADCPAMYAAFTNSDLYSIWPTKNIQWLLNQEVNAHIHIDGHGSVTTKAGIIAYKKKYQIEIGLTNAQTNSAYIDPITLGHMNAKLCAW